MTLFVGLGNAADRSQIKVAVAAERVAQAVKRAAAVLPFLLTTAAGSKLKIRPLPLRVAATAATGAQAVRAVQAVLAGPTAKAVTTHPAAKAATAVKAGPAVLGAKAAKAAAVAWAVTASAFIVPVVPITKIREIQRTSLTPTVTVGTTVLAPQHPAATMPPTVCTLPEESAKPTGPNAALFSF